MSSENEDSENEAVVSVKRIKKRTIVDSDSDEDVGNQLITNAGGEASENSSDGNVEEKVIDVKVNQIHSVRRIKRVVSSSDSDGENGYLVGNNPGDGSNRITESMSMGDEISEKKLKSVDDDSQDSSKPVYKPFTNSDLYDAEDSEEETAHFNKSPSQNEKSNGVQDSEMYDAEEEDDDGHKISYGKNDELKDKKKEKKKREKVKSSSKGMREIRRESQRMIRESSCVLPYHRPKQRTLAEFIQRRKSVPSIPLKTSQEHLMRIGKQIEELEKQSEDFFKSDDSDGSDDEYIPDYVKNKNKTELKTRTDSSINDNVVDINLDNNCTVNADINIKDSDEKKNCDNLMDSCETRVSTQISEETVSLQSVVNTSSLPSQNDNYANDTSELLNKVKQKLFDEINLKKNFDSSETECKSSADVSVSNTESSQSECKFKDDGCVTSSNVDNSNIPQENGEKCNFELKINEDSNKKLESELVNENGCKEMVGVSDSVVESNCTYSEKSAAVLEIDNVIKSVQSKASSYCFQDSEDFSLRIEESEEIEVNSAGIDKVRIPENPSNKDNNINLSQHDDNNSVGESNLEKIDELAEKGNENLNYDGKLLQGFKSSVECEENKSKLTENDLLKNKFQGLDVDLKKVPQLTGNSKDKIHLYSPPKPSAILELKKRFFHHFTMEKKKKVPEKVEISVVTAEVSSEGAVNDIKHETINAAVNKSEEKWLEDLKEAQLPGAKLSILKAHLEKQLKERLKEDWNRRIQEYKLNEEKVDEDGKSDYEEEAILDDENVETDITETESEEELEENDVLLVDKKRPQSKFLDDEADETDGEGQEDCEDAGDDEIEENEDILLGNNGSDVNDDDNDDDDERRSENEVVEDEDIDNQEDCINQMKDQKEKVKKSDHLNENFLPPAVENSSLKDKDFHANNENLSQFSNKSSQYFLNSQDYKSGKFTRIEDLVNNTEGFDKLSQSDIMRICSGTFPSQPVALSQLENTDEKLKYSEFNDSQSEDLNLTLPDFSQDKPNDGDDKLGKGLRKHSTVLDSDDEEDAIFEKSQKNKRHKIKYSDDESESNNEGDDNENDDNDDEIDEQEDMDEGGDIIGDENEDAEVEYDSEENEIIKDGKSFLEKEAELSESEWGSEDEDEKDLDNFEAEAGDADQLDEDSVKGELEKIHMQRMLVEDKNEVRLLKELLLEDGELHSDESGRVRRFRWANADGEDGGQIGLLKDSDDEDSDHGDEDENWRRIRHERELYIQKQQEKLKELGIEDIIDDKKNNDQDDLLNMGRAMLKKIQKTHTESKPLGLQKSIKIKVGIGPGGLTSSASVKRGSFLKGSNNFLSRLAHITSKVGSEGNVNGPKNSRNFVFSIVSPPKKDQEDDEAENKMVKKRKADENIGSSKKKIHFSDEIKSNGPHTSLLEMLTTSN